MPHWTSHVVGGRTTQRYSWRPGQGPMISAVGKRPDQFKSRKGWSAFVSNLAKRPDPVSLSNPAQSKNLIGQALNSGDFGQVVARHMTTTGDLSLASALQVHVLMSGHSNIGGMLEMMDDGIRKVAESQSFAAASWVFKRSQQLVPYDSGVLHDAGYIREREDTGEGIWWEVGYDTDSVVYAWEIHENTNKDHTLHKNPYPDEQDDKQAHFLSDPAEEMQAWYKDSIAESLDKMMQLVARAGTGRTALSEARISAALNARLGKIYGV